MYCAAEVLTAGRLETKVLPSNEETILELLAPPLLTGCPDVCTVAVASMEDILEAGGSNEDAVVVSSTDPEIDASEEIKMVVTTLD